MTFPVLWREWEGIPALVPMMHLSSAGSDKRGSHLGRKQVIFNAFFGMSEQKQWRASTRIDSPFFRTSTDLTIIYADTQFSLDLNGKLSQAVSVSKLA